MAVENEMSEKSVYRPTFLPVFSKAKYFPSGEVS